MKKPLSSLQDDLKKLDEEAKGASHLNQENPLLAPIARALQSRLLDDKAKKKSELARARQDFIEGIHQVTKRAYKELPHFFKFCLFKTTPRRVRVVGKRGEFIQPVKAAIEFRGLPGVSSEPERLPEHAVKATIDFRGIKAEVIYFDGELGDRDRMVYLAILNEAIRHKEFVKEFGKIPFSMNELADKAGFSSSHQREEWVEESLTRLMRTEVHFLNGFGDFRFKGRFHLLESYYTLEKVKVTDEVKARLKTAREQALIDQANALLEKFKPRTPKLTLVKFNEPLMEAIQGHQITTVDMWALKRLSGNPARSLYLYLWDVSQWRRSQEPFELSLTELLTLLDVTLPVDHKGEKEYLRWKRARDYAEEVVKEVNQVAQFLDWYEWEGEQEQTRLRLKLSQDTLQIPPR